MITITDLDYRIGNKPILHNINLELAPGGIIALIGPNGAGKSTLLSLIARLNPLQSGSIRVDTLDIATSDSRAIARKLAILQQQTRFMSRLTIEELLTFARFPYHRGRPRARPRHHRTHARLLRPRQTAPHLHRRPLRRTTPTRAGRDDLRPGHRLHPAR